MKIKSNNTFNDEMSNSYKNNTPNKKKADHL